MTRPRPPRTQYFAALRAWQRALLPLLGILLLGAIFNAHGAFFRWQTHASLLREVSVYQIEAGRGW